MSRDTRVLPLVTLAAVLIGCAGPPPTPVPAAQPLLDLWPEARVEQAVVVEGGPPLLDLRFDGAGTAGFRWHAVQGIADLRLEDGRLVGRTTSAEPVILLEADAPLGGDDDLWSAAVRLRVSVGSRVSVQPVKEPGPPLPAVLGRIGAWPLSSPLVPGDEPATYSVDVDDVFLLEMPTGTERIRQILVRPSNEEGADFAIESVRLTFRKERLASIPSGPGWHGLGEVFRESLVSRAPESLSFRLTLPERPWLDLSVGSVAEPLPSFEVSIASIEGDTAGEAQSLETLVPEAKDRWRDARLDLEAWAGETVELRLRATDAPPGSLALWGTPTVRGSTSEPGERPGTVLVFLCDTLRSDHLDAWGYGRETAPTLSRLAAEGTRFADVVAQATWTKASVSSILTSLYPATTGIEGLHDRVAAGETTLAEVFRAAGYATFATSSVPFSGQLTNLHQGVEVMFELGALGEMDGGFQSKTAAAWTDIYLDWLSRHRDVPTFALVHVMDPHSPFRPRSPYDERWAEPGGAERFAAQADQVRPLIRSPLMKRFIAPSREELREAGVDEASFVKAEKDWYDGSIRGMDAELERLLATMGEMGVRDDTLLAFISDHGEEFLEHGAHWHGRTVYGEVANVPLVLWGRGVPAGKVVEQTVQTVDLMPTLIELAGLEAPERAQGRSLVSLLMDEDARELPAFTEARGRGRPGGHDTFSIIDEGWKLVWRVGDLDSVPEHELFDHQADPLNLKDVASEYPDVVARLAPRVERWQRWAEAQRLDPSAIESEVSAAELERLRSLGYVN